MNLNLENKNAIVCASSQGLGKAAAIDLAKEGVNLAICSRDQEKIDKAKEEILQKTDHNIKVIAFKEKGEWTLESKYNIGKKRTTE